MMKGSFPTLITPLTPNSQIDYYALSTLIELHNLHSEGLVLFDATGEGWLLNNNDKRLILKHVQSMFKKKIIINIPCWSAQGSEEALEHYNELIEGVDGFLIAAPPYLKLNDEQVFEFFDQTIQHFHNKAIISHNPARNQAIFTPQLSNWIQNDRRIIGIKESVREHLSRYVETPEWTLFAGEDNFMGLPFCTSSMSVGGNLFPELFAQPDYHFSWSIWSELLALKANPAIIKALMYLEGLIASPLCLEPIGGVSKPQMDSIKTHYHMFKQSTLTSLQFTNE